MPKSPVEEVRNVYAQTTVKVESGDGLIHVSFGKTKTSLDLPAALKLHLELKAHLANAIQAPGHRECYLPASGG